MKKHREELESKHLPVFSIQFWSSAKKCDCICSTANGGGKSCSLFSEQKSQEHMNFLHCIWNRYANVVRGLPRVNNSHNGRETFLPSFWRRWWWCTYCLLVNMIKIQISHYIWRVGRNFNMWVCFLRRWNAKCGKKLRRKLLLGASRGTLNKLHIASAFLVPRRLLWESVSSPTAS